MSWDASNALYAYAKIWMQVSLRQRLPLHPELKLYLANAVSVWFEVEA